MTTPMTAIDLLLVCLVLIAMTAIAVVDARRMIVDPRLVLALVGAGLLWRLFGSAEMGSLLSGGLGAVLGLAVVAAPIAAAQWRRRPWPLFPGDAMMLGGLGFVLGPLGLGWSLLAGSGFGLLYRVWLQRRRGRAFHRGYCPLGPGMVAGAVCVFLFVNAGGSLAAEPLPPPLRPQIHHASALAPAPARPGPMEAAGETATLAATEIAPVRVPLPAALAAREIAVDEAEVLSFAHVTGRIATLSGVRVEVEERPARVAGGALALTDPPDMRLTFEGSLPGLLNRVAAYTGYDWTWSDGAIVFYRHWDIEQRTPEVPAAASVEVEGEIKGQAGDTAGPWLVDRSRHPTLRSVLEDWAARAEWSVVWKPERSYAIGADASFAGSFLDAVDRLLAAPATRRSLAALAYEPNRHLVIEDRGSPWSRGSAWSRGTPWYAGAVR